MVRLPVLHWESNGLQHEVGYASLAMGLAGIYASTVDLLNDFGISILLFVLLIATGAIS